MPEFGKRKLERFPLKLPAHIVVDGEEKEAASLDAITSDISAGGAFFHTGTPLPVGTEMYVDLILPLDELKKIEGKRAKIKVRGTVIRTGEKGMAISFDRKYRISPMPG
ncbi:MAG: PilZ domain-containing protein [Deltaproteobacteria bacterium]|nr:PilZ domain-containing protein [Deltaproteobacteria bacterium]MBW2674210.1 PilZ domain-containing protein [Deltaproteobacteria bacterium]